MRAPPLLAALLLLACDRGAAPPPAQPPETATPTPVTTPPPAAPPASPAPTDPFDAMIVDWPATDGSELLNLLSVGRPIFVAVSGGATRLAPACEGPELTYSFRPATPRSDRSTHDGKDLETTIVGAWQATPPTARDQLRGECGGVTHVARQIVVGAYVLTGSTSTAARVDANLPGGGVVGGSTTSTTSTENKGGSLTACADATATSPRPPSNCSAGIRLALVHVGP